MPITSPATATPWQASQAYAGQPDTDTAPLLVHRSGARPRPIGFGEILQMQPVHALHDCGLLGADITLAADRRAMPDMDRVEGAAWLIYAACVQARRCGGIAISLNLPDGTSLDPDLVWQTQAALARSALSPDRLRVGLGERTVAALGAEALLALSALRDAGVGVTLDAAELQTGLRLLCRLPVTCLRLQPSLVLALPQSRQLRSALAEAIDVAHALDASVFALGVPDALHRDILADLACDAASGPVFGPPMTADRFRAALQQPWPTVQARRDDRSAESRQNVAGLTLHRG